MIHYIMLVIGIDYITGICKSYYNKNLSSYCSVRGIAKKIGECCLITLVYILDIVMKSNGVLFTGFGYLIIANEGLSILENLGQMNVYVPKFIKNHLEDIKKEGE